MRQNSFANFSLFPLYNNIRRCSIALQTACLLVVKTNRRIVAWHDCIFAISCTGKRGYPQAELNQFVEVPGSLEFQSRFPFQRSLKSLHFLGFFTDDGRRASSVKIFHAMYSHSSSLKVKAEFDTVQIYAGLRTKFIFFCFI